MTMAAEQDEIFMQCFYLTLEDHESHSDYLIIFNISKAMEKPCKHSTFVLHESKESQLGCEEL